MVLTLQEQAEKLHQLEDDLLHLREKGQESPKVESPSEESPTESPPPANHIIDAIAHPAEPHSPESPAAEATVPETQPTAPRLAPANHPINFDHLRAAFKKALPYALDSRTVEETPAWNRLTQGIVTIRKTGPRAESGSVDETLANIEKHLEAQQAQEALVHLRRLPPSMQHPFEDLIRTLTTSLALPQVQP